MARRMVNLGCGSVYVKADSWVNVDFVSNVDGVIGVNLLEPMPFDNCSFDVVYSSHFYEHIPQYLIPCVISEWHRILRPGGVVRLVIPDCQEMFSEYLRQRVDGDQLLADFVIAEIVDQCVRTYPGGRLGQFYALAASAESPDSSRLATYIYARNGETLSYFNRSGAPSIHDHAHGKLMLYLRRFKRRLSNGLRVLGDFVRLKIVGVLYGKAFIRQNVSFANVGERHHWLWDFHQVQQVLLDAGFASVVRCTHRTSSVPDFPFIPLDMNEDGAPRKGRESMYIEATKPIT